MAQADWWSRDMNAHFARVDRLLAKESVIDALLVQAANGLPIATTNGPVEVGHGPPATDSGEVGALYLDLDTGILYQKES